MKKAFIMVLSLVMITIAGMGFVAADADNNTNNTVNASVPILSPSATGGSVNNSGNSHNVNTNTIIVKSTNLNRQIQVHSATPKTIVVYVKAVPVTNATPTAAAGEESNATNGTNVPMQKTGVDFAPLLIGMAGLAGGYFASRFRS